MSAMWGWAGLAQYVSSWHNGSSLYVARGELPGVMLECRGWHERGCVNDGVSVLPWGVLKWSFIKIEVLGSYAPRFILYPLHWLFRMSVNLYFILLFVFLETVFCSRVEADISWFYSLAGWLRTANPPASASPGIRFKKYITGLSMS